MGASTLRAIVLAGGAIGIPYGAIDRLSMLKSVRLSWKLGLLNGMDET